jgi:hypothetical protein
VTEADLIKVLNSIKNKQSTKSDGMSSFALKKCSSYVTEVKEGIHLRIMPGGGSLHVLSYEQSVLIIFMFVSNMVTCNTEHCAFSC